MKRKEPKYITPVDIFLPPDRIKPYGGMISDFSSIRCKFTILKLWMGEDFEKYKNMWQQEYEDLSIENVEGQKSFLNFIEQQNLMKEKQDTKVYKKNNKRR